MNNFQTKFSTFPFHMPHQQNMNSVILSVLVFSSLFYLATSHPGPTERIFDASIVQNLNDKSSCVAIIAYSAVLPLDCTVNGNFYAQECTAAVIGRKTLLGNANCIKNVFELQSIGYQKFTFAFNSKYPVLLLGAKSASADDIDAPGVVKISLQDAVLEYHPDYNGSSHDLVAIKLNSALQTSVCPQPFSIPSKLQDELTYAGPFMISWGQPACTGLSFPSQTYSIAKQTSVCSNDVDGFTKADDQICVSLKRVQDNTVTPKATQGDPGAPIYVSVSSGGKGNTAQYILQAILGLFPKSDPVLYPDPYGQGCSKTSVVPAANLLDSKNMAFLNDLATQQKDIVKSPIPDQIPV